MAKHRVTLKDRDPFEVDVSLPDLVRFERTYDQSVAAMKNDGRLEWVMFVTYQACLRTGKFEGDFEAFLDALRDLEVEGAAENAEGDAEGGDDGAPAQPHS